MRLDEEGVLHVAGWMVVGKVQTAVHMPVVLHFGTFRQGEAETAEDVDNLVLDNRKRMARAEGNGIRRAGEVLRSFSAAGGSSGTLLQGVNLVVCKRLQFIYSHAHLFLQFGRHAPEVVHQLCYLTFLAQILDAQGFCFLGIFGLKVSNFLHQTLYFLYHTVVLLRFRVQKYEIIPNP